MAAVLPSTSRMVVPGKANHTIATSTLISRPKSVQPMLHVHPSFSPRTHVERSRIPSTSFASSELATYPFQHHSSVTHSTSAPWFEKAITEVVKHLESAPFLQLVRLPGTSTTPSFTNFSVPESVVSAPELWASIAESVTAATADVVILVQRVDPHGSGSGAPSSSSSLQQQQQENSTSSHRRQQMKSHVEDVYRKIVNSGMGESIFSGKVGECCDHMEIMHSSNTSSSSNCSNSYSSTSTTPQTSIVPFASGALTSATRSISPSPSSSAAAAARTAVKVKALPIGGAPSAAPVSGYWGVVVQSKHHTGTEGCYLLRAVRQTTQAEHVDGGGGGCHCTHFSLTRVCQGEHVERQFINSWLV